MRLLDVLRDGTPRGAFSDNVAECSHDLGGVGAAILKRCIAPFPRGSAIAACGTLFLPSRA
jgi:hypothetical protein